jgi:tripartite-type tricarboxylate transporter receptor subunit TctC
MIRAGHSPVITATAAALLALVASASAQTYPARQVSIIVPYAPGGATDTLARLIGQKLSESFGKPFIIENRPGASSMIGTEAVVKAAPDGYTLLVAGTSLVTSKLTYKDRVPYKISDLAPVGLIAKTPMSLEINPSVPAHSVKEFVAYAKANPGKLNYATFGEGTIPDLTCKLINGSLGIQMVGVSYKGAAPAMNDLIGGTIQVFCDITTTSVPLGRSGKSRVLAVLNEKRVAFAPEIPTFAELGYSGLVASTTFGLLAPAGTPQPIIKKLNEELSKIVASKTVSDRIEKLGSVPLGGTPDDFAASLKAEEARWQKVVGGMKGSN